jgi:predicted GNAT superfamily acetyltransferase
MSALITEFHEVGELRELERLFAEIWERQGVPPISSDTMKALAHSGNYVVGARLDGRLVGGLVGWIGGVPPGELHMHSHILGIVADIQARGVGFDLKQHQRRWCLDRGLRVVEWTFDPLVRRNANFNLTKLGAEAREYLVNVYGTMADGINAGEESDRLLISWRLDSPGAVAAAEGRPAAPDVDDLLRGEGSVILSVGPRQEPVPAKLTTPVGLCQVPADIVALRQSEPTIARAWRLAAREAMLGALNAGYRVIGATRSGWYVLKN